jgi:glycine/D-amino acid oxidase-like deaminating enzyme
MNPSEADILVVGGGIMGCSVAYYLAMEHGVTSCVVDRDAVAAGASGKAGGFLAKDWHESSGLAPLAALSFDLHCQLADEFGYKTIDFRRLPARSLDIRQGRHPVLDKAQKNSQKEKSQKYVVPAWLDTPNNHVLRCEKIADGSNTAQVHPRKLCASLMRKACEKGAMFTVGHVQNVEYIGKNNVDVVIDGQLHNFKQVVLCGGPWSRDAQQWFGSLPLVTYERAHSIVLSPNVPKNGITPEACFFEFTPANGKTQCLEAYPRPDNTVYLCGMSDDEPIPSDGPIGVHPSQASIDSLLSMSKCIAPVLNDAVLLQAQACYLPTTASGLPLIGPVPQTEHSIFIGAGHGCWGILCGPATGKLIANALCTGEMDPLMTLYAPLPPL